jgi:transposase
LYKTPPVNTHVLCLDELGPLSMKTYLTSRWSSHGYRPHVVPDYGRRGKLWTFGAFEPASGDVLTTTALAHRTDDFLLFLDQVAAHWPEGDLIFILDNLSIHRAFDVKLWALAHPRVRFLFQPTYAPWLNLIEPWWKTLRSLALNGRRFETVDQWFVPFAMPRSTGWTIVIPLGGVKPHDL